MYKLILLMILSASAFAGRFDEEIKEFKAVANEAINLLEDTSLSGHGKSSIDLFTLKLNLKLATVKFTKKTLTDKYGMEKQALNFPLEKLIKVNIHAWRKVKDDRNIVLPLVLHEYLGLSGEEEDNYDKSRVLLDLNQEKVEQQTLQKKQALARAQEVFRAQEKEALMLATPYFEAIENQLSKITLKLDESKIKEVLSKNYAPEGVNPSRWGIFSIADISSLYYSRPFTRISVIENGSDAFWKNGRPSGEYRPRTTWDDDLYLIDPMRDRFCRDLGYSISTSYQISRFDQYGNTYHEVHLSKEGTKTTGTKKFDRLDDMSSVSCLKIQGY